MLAHTARMADVRRRLAERERKGTERRTAGVPKSLMPDIGGDDVGEPP